MITIITRTNDATSTQVINWMRHMSNDVEVVRINTDSKNIAFHSYCEATNEFQIKIDDCIVDLSRVKVNWYRKGGKLFGPALKDSLSRDYFNDNSQGVRTHLTNEQKVLEEHVHHFLESADYSLGSSFNATLNKLIVLAKAKKLGLKTPSVSIVKSKDKLDEVLGSGPGVITKALSDGVYSFGKGKSFYSYTEKIEKHATADFPDSFFPTLLQSQIDKKYEIRTFFLDDKFYSMAIFSQNNEQTKVDFRKYDGTKPNRNVPFQLPQEIEEKLRMLFKDLRLNTGSSDIIVDQNGEYVFLEINPVGQFSMVSYPCNFYLEKKVAELLLRESQSN